MRFARQDFATLNQKLTVEQALASIRQRGVGEKIVYFYVVDDAEQLVGVVPTRRLLMAPLEQPLSDLMIRNVIAISPEAFMSAGAWAIIRWRLRIPRPDASASKYSRTSGSSGVSISGSGGVASVVTGSPEACLRRREIRARDEPPRLPRAHMS